MGLLALLFGAVAAYLYFTGQLTRQLLAVGLLGLLAVELLRAGRVGPAALAAAAAIAFGTWHKVKRPSRQIGIDEAREVLGVGADASADAIRSAHRRLVARVHPDTGGSAELAARVNAARDVLLAELKRRAPRRS